MCLLKDYHISNFFDPIGLNICALIFGYVQGTRQHWSKYQFHQSVSLDITSTLNVLYLKYELEIRFGVLDGGSMMPVQNIKVNIGQVSSRGGYYIMIQYPGTI